MAEPAAGPASNEPESVGIIAADDAPLDQDVADGDSAVGTGLQSDNTSLMSSIMKYRQENGRTYHAFKDGAYVLPNDEIEKERLDLQHHLFALTFGGKLHLATLPKNLHNVLDAGTGTGIWAIDFADEHPECKVTGVDLSPIQPPYVPPNVLFYVDDIEDEWTFATKFDFIFVRFMTGSITDWPKFFKRSFEQLNPGGVIEIQDIVYPCKSDDGSVTKDQPIYRWSKIVADGFASMGRPVDTALGYRSQLEEAGFTNIVCHTHKWPLNRWPKDEKYKEIGLWTYENMLQAVHSLSLAIFTRPKEEGGLGWTVQELELLLTEVRADLRNLKIHGYFPIYTFHATKPE